MLEAFFIIGIIGALIAFIGDSLTSLEAFPTICVGCVLVPIMSWRDFARLVQENDLVKVRRSPLPPARFYWSLRGPRLRLDAIALIPIAIAAWGVAIGFPASFGFDRTSAIGWLAGLLAVAATTRMISSTMTYFRGSQWIDPMSPAIVGSYRRLMFWLSEDAEFLGRGQLKPQNERERAIY